MIVQETQGKNNSVKKLEKWHVRFVTTFCSRLPSCRTHGSWQVKACMRVVLSYHVLVKSEQVGSKCWWELTIESMYESCHNYHVLVKWERVACAVELDDVNSLQSLSHQTPSNTVDVAVPAWAFSLKDETTADVQQLFSLRNPENAKLNTDNNGQNKIQLSSCSALPLYEFGRIMCVLKWGGGVTL